VSDSRRVRSVMRKASPEGTHETMSSGAPLTIWYNLSTNPEGVPFLPSPLEGTGLVDFGRVVVICYVRRG